MPYRYIVELETISQAIALARHCRPLLDQWSQERGSRDLGDKPDADADAPSRVVLLASKREDGRGET